MGHGRGWAWRGVVWEKDTGYPRYGALVPSRASSLGYRSVVMRTWGTGIDEWTVWQSGLGVSWLYEMRYHSMQYHALNPNLASIGHRQGLVLDFTVEA